MLVNRSSPSATVIPVLAYDDVATASDWLCDVFGFRERLRIGSHRAQLVFGDGAVIVTERRVDPDAGTHGPAEPPPYMQSHSVHVRVEAIDRHFEHARQHGALILNPPTDYPFGERQYSVQDLGGHRWTFSQSIADVAPEAWGGTSRALE